ncbi:MAG: Tetracycline resistance protein, class C [Alphaproteobacteria bacterium MarineAlpha3_Bin4]|nr:MAG: Tetracycline resistance protein, class C [Alphaproteobacteria bacterium MarineAlpha3_Bin4]
MPILFLIVVIDLIGFGVIIPLLPFYGEYYQAAPATVGLLMATYSFAQFLAAPFWGRLSDRTGRRPVLLISLCGAALSYVWLGFADSLWMLFAARAMGGFMAGNISTAFAYVADVTTRENRARGMGVIGAAFGLGFIIGPAVGGLLAGPDPVNADFQRPAFAAAGFSFAALVLALFLLKESLSEETRKRLAQQPPRTRIQLFRQALSRPNVALLIGMSFLATFAFAGLEATFAMWSRRQFGWGPEQNGYLFAFVGLLGAIVQGRMVGGLVRRFGEARLIVQGAAALCTGVLLIPLASNLPLLVVAITIAAYGFSIISPSLNSLISLQVGDDEQGGVMGVTRSATTLARVLGPAWAGLLFSVLGKDWPYFGGAAVMAIVVVVCFRAIPQLEHPKPPPAA